MLIVPNHLVLPVKSSGRFLAMAGLWLVAAISAPFEAAPAGAASADLGQGTDVESATSSIVADYCRSAFDPASEARASVLNARMLDRAAELEDLVSKLEAATVELKDWVERREALLDSVGDTLTGIFKNLRPDAAAAQLSELNSARAAAIILRLPPKNASEILAEMAPEDAAAITSVLGAVGRKGSGQ